MPPMSFVNVSARPSPSSPDLIARAEAGEEIVIARTWRKACCTPRCMQAAQGSAGPAVLKGKWAFTEDFFDPLPEEELKLWEGE